MNGFRAMLGLALLVSSSCVERGEPSRTIARPPPAAPAALDPKRSPDGPIVIVTIDGVRWQEVFDGTDIARSHAPRIAASALLPNLYRLGTERGAFVGAPGFGTMTASGPNFVSLPGYNELLSGRPDHGCGGNDCGRTRSPTLLDEARADRAKVGAFASWAKLSHALTNEPGAFFVASGPPLAGRGDAGDLDASRSDHETASAALAYFEAERPDVFFLGLGETDEHAHFGNYAGYIEALRHADTVVGHLLALLEQDERGRRAHVFVTADHGRAADFQNHGSESPESARVWMVASGPRIAARGFVASARARHLSDIAPTIRSVLGTTASLPGRGTVIDELFAPSSP